MSACAYKHWMIYPIFVNWPIVTQGPTTVPDPTWTFAPKTDFEWTMAPISISTVGSMQADLWKWPPPFCHFRNSCASKPAPFSILTNKTWRKTKLNFSICPLRHFNKRLICYGNWPDFTGPLWSVVWWVEDTEKL